MTTYSKIYDFIGIGVGPFNLSLACLAKPIEGLEGLFFDQKESFNWHPGMLLENTTLQVPFMADLVTMADPTSQYSFLNYLKEKGKIYPYYIRESFFILRNEYNQYCQWAIAQLSNIFFGHKVLAINYHEEKKLYYVLVETLKTQEQKVYITKKLILGTGTTPWIPECCKNTKGDITHSSQYLMNKAALQEKKAITVVGSGQSAAEIFNDLLQEIDTRGYKLSWITRSPRYFPLDYSKLTLEMTSPEYVDYFFGLPNEQRDNLIKHQKHLYKGINQDLIGEIYDTIYAKRVLNDIDIELRTNSALKDLSHTTAGDQLLLQFHHTEQDKDFQHNTEALILATGYQARIPDFIKNIKSRIQWDQKGRYDVQRNYSIDLNGQDIFVQNAELHTHGFVTPDLGMGAYRNAFILKEITGKEHYKIEQKIASQQFGVAGHEFSTALEDAELI